MLKNEMLQNRIQRRLSIIMKQENVYDTFFECVRLKNFIKTSDILNSILNEIPITSDLPQKVLDCVRSGSMLERKEREGESYELDTLIAWYIFKELGETLPDTNSVTCLSIGTIYGGTPNHWTGVIKQLQKWAENIAEYLLDKLNNNQVILYSLIKYKQSLEWFPNIPNNVHEQKAKFLETYDKQKKTLEPDFFMPHLYRFLHQEGLNFYIEVERQRSTKGYLDFIAISPDKEIGYLPLIGEGKHISSTENENDIVRKCQESLKQVHEYLSDFNVTNGYLIFFWENKKLKLNNSLATIDHLGINYIEYSGKRIFIVIIDIAANDSPSTSKSTSISMDCDEWMQAIKH